jgi:hemerythrin-like metal-binding protein
MTSALSPLPVSLATANAQNDDHQELLGLARDLAAAADEDLAAGFEALHSRFAEHFAVEDAWMAGHDFSSRECHLDEHAAVLRSFEEVGALLRGGDLQSVRRMALALADWLPEHIDALDRHLAKFMFFQQTGGAPVLLHR